MKWNKGLDYEELYHNYFNLHKEEYIESSVQDCLTDESYIQDIMEDNDFTTIEEVKGYLYDTFEN